MSDLEERLLVLLRDAGDYPLPEPELPEEPDGLLYDSQRDYFEQLEAYKAHRQGTGNGKDSDGGNAE
jgi:hypothetical protein